LFGGNGWPSEMASRGVSIVMLTLFQPCRKTAAGVTLTSLRYMPINETIRPGREEDGHC
jgi:hypothetical protein